MLPKRLLFFGSQIFSLSEKMLSETDSDAFKIHTYNLKSQNLHTFWLQMTRHVSSEVVEDCGRAQSNKQNKTAHCVHLSTFQEERLMKWKKK